MKLDLKKAFDTMSWKFMFDTLDRMGFPKVFISLVKVYIETTMLSVKINGSLEGFFQAKLGLRKGPHVALFVCSS